jgi:hypothetical protein
MVCRGEIKIVAALLMDTARDCAKVAEERLQPLLMSGIFLEHYLRGDYLFFSRKKQINISKYSMGSKTLKRLRRGRANLTGWTT